MTTIHLLTGSNLGDRHAHLQKATQLIEKHIGKVVEKSSYYQSEAWGNEEQFDFFNQALSVKTSLTPQQVLAKIHDIEASMGRVHGGEKWTPRTIDIDILLFGDKVIKESNLAVPHPLLHERNFALVPLLQIAGETLHPTLELTIEEIYFDCEDELTVYLLEL
ncbi:MAG: hypothetical protein RLZZ292_3220 [Bacteroidota bacterium]|jgi:2-amino-4-hydroxy-6-hydroxymethyldihydropteridine diphosphokinase